MQRIQTIAEEQDNYVSIRSPLVGIISQLPPEESLLVANQKVAQVNVLGSKYELQLGTLRGKVVYPHDRDHLFPVEYGEEIFQLYPLTENETDPNFAGLSSGKQQAGENQYVVKAPTDGMFYRRPSPDTPCFIEEGQTIKQGQVLALIEVMKTFNQVYFEGPQYPEQAKVVEICVEDATEVAHKQPIVILQRLS